MNLKEMKLKVLSLIEELNTNSQYLTDDPDIQAKINYVTNQILFELARIKKIPKYVELKVSEGDRVEFADIEKECGYEVFQVKLFGGVANAPKADGTVYKILEDGTAEIDCYIYPESITGTTKDTYEFELSADALEIMPYGIAADLLKSDVSAEYGNIYATRYESMKQMLDPRYAMPMVTIEGGVDV
jgi:hypothetical protein